jgi:hypothetical protein
MAGECKWTSRETRTETLDALRAKVARLWPDQAAQIRLAIFSAGGFSPALLNKADGQRVFLFDCRDLTGERQEA